MAAGVGVGGGQVDLVDHRNYLKSGVNRKICICKRLSLNSLCCVHHKQCTLTGVERARDLVVEVNMPGRVDEVQLVHLTVRSLVIKPDGTRFYGYSPFPLKLHVVKHLLLHVALGDGSRSLKQTVGKGAFAVIDMSDDRKIPDMCAVGSLH